VRAMEAAGSLKDKQVPPDYQAAMRLSCAAPLCFELVATNRFKNNKLRDLIAFMRKPTKTLPPEIHRYWELIQMRTHDQRLSEERFQTGHMIAIYWATVSRWMGIRARRDAAALDVPLFLLQAAVSATPAMPLDLIAKMLNKSNPKDTGCMHGALHVHVGMHFRLLAALDIDKGLVKDAQGEIVHVVINPADQALVGAAVAAGKQFVYPKYLPLGIWARMKKFKQAPFSDALNDPSDGRPTSLRESLVFIQPHTASPFKLRGPRVISWYLYVYRRPVCPSRCR
jgi:hypothetical protein